MGDLVLDATHQHVSHGIFGWLHFFHSRIFPDFDLLCLLSSTSFSLIEERQDGEGPMDLPDCLVAASEGELEQAPPLNVSVEAQICEG